MEEIGGWDEDIAELDEGGPGSPDPGIVHGSTGDAGGIKGDDQNRNSPCSWPAGSDGGGNVVGPDAVSDPFLRSIDNIAISFLNSGCLDISDIGSSYPSSNVNEFSHSYKKIKTEEGRVIGGNGERREERKSRQTIWFGNAQTKSNTPICHTRKEPCFLLSSTVINNRRDANSVSSS